MENTLTIIYASSDKFAPFCGVSIASLLFNNASRANINLYILNDNISLENIEALKAIAQSYRCKINFISFSIFTQKFKDLNLPEWGGSYAAYFKFFFTEFLSDDVEDAIYIDCDTVIHGDLTLIQQDVRNITGKYAIYAVLDSLPSYYNLRGIGLTRDSKYINSGILFFNIKRWKELSCVERIVTHIREVRSNYPIADQDLINIVFQNEIGILPLKYNCTAFMNLFTPKQIYSILEFTEENYYTEDEILSAVTSPVVAHYAGTLVGRPWVRGFRNNFTEIWDKYLAMTPWKNMVKVKDGRSLIRRCVKLFYKVMPKCISSYLIKVLLRFTWLVLLIHPKYNIK